MKREFLALVFFLFSLFFLLPFLFSSLRSGPLSTFSDRKQRDVLNSNHDFVFFTIVAGERSITRSQRHQKQQRRRRRNHFFEASSAALAAAAPTALATAPLTPASSSTATPAIVAPPGEHTRSRRTAGCASSRRGGGAPPSLYPAPRALPSPRPGPA